VVGEIETMRVCRRAGVGALKVEDLFDRVELIAVDERVRRLAAAVDPPTLRALDSIHLATALSLEDLEFFVAYDTRLVAAAGEAGLSVLSPA
jgi:predicted nucleic acid-binding protein